MAIQGSETRPALCNRHSLRLFLPSCSAAVCGVAAGSLSLQGFLREHRDGADLYLPPGGGNEAYCSSLTPASAGTSGGSTAPSRSPRPGAHSEPQDEGSQPPGPAPACPWPCAPGRSVSVLWACKDILEDSQPWPQQKLQQQQPRQPAQAVVVLQGCAKLSWRGRAVCVPLHASLALEATQSPAASTTGTPKAAACTAGSGGGQRLGAGKGRAAAQRERAAVATTPAPREAAASPVRLLVFLYDIAAWRQVAQAETALAAAGGDVRAQAAGAAATCHGVPLALPLPLPLRLALRPAADPFTRCGVGSRGTRCGAQVSPETLRDGKRHGRGAGRAASRGTQAARAATVPGAAAAAPHRHPLPLPLLHPLLRHAVAAGTQAVLDQSAACSHARHIAHCVSTLRQLHAHYRGGDSGPGGTAGATASFRSRRGAAASSAALRKPVSAGAASKGPHELAAAPRVTGSDVSGRGVHHSGGLALAACVLLSLLVQLAAGPVAAAALWRHRTALAGAVEAGAAGAEQMLREQYDWLATATPAGVKLHGELCALAAAAAHGLLSVGRAAARATWPRCWGAAAAAVAAAFGLAGLGGGLALLHDLLLLTAAGPLRLQAAATAALLRRHVGWLAAAWAMMRGGGEATAAARRRRQLRQQAAQQRRAQSGGDGTAGGAPASAAFAAAAAASAGADGGVPISRLETLLGLAPDPGARDEVVVEPLIVGVLLFVPLLALLPSVAAWHLLVASAAAVAAAARAALAAAAGLLRLNPVVMLGWRLARPLDFAGSDVFLQHMPLHPTSHALVAQPPGPTRAHAAGGSAAGGAAGPAVATRRAPQPPVATSAPKLTKRRGRTAPPHTSEYTDRFQDQADEQLGRRPAPGTGGVAMRARGADRSAGGAGSAAADDGDGGSGAGGCARPGTLCFGVTPLPRGAFQVAAGSLREGMQGAWCASGTLGPAAVLLDAARLLAARRL